MPINLSKWISEYRQQNPNEQLKYRDAQGNSKTDSYEFPNISQDIQQKGYLQRDEFRAIGRWKYAPNDYLYKRNSQNEVEKQTGRAIQVYEKPEAKVEALRELDGVGVPVASAILSVVFPNDYATMDYRALRTLPWASSSPILQNHNDFSQYIDAFREYNHSEAAYEYYLNEVRQIAQNNNRTAREVDMALWAYDKDKNP